MPTCVHNQLAHAPWWAHISLVPLATWCWADILLAWTLIFTLLCNMLPAHSKWECWELIPQQRLHHRLNPVPYLIVPHFAIFGHAADFLSSFSGTQHQYLPFPMSLGAHVVPKTAPHTEEHLKGAVSFFLSDSPLIQYIPTNVSLPFIPPNQLPTSPLPQIYSISISLQKTASIFSTQISCPSENLFPLSPVRIEAL